MGKDLFRAWIESQERETQGTLEFGSALGSVTFVLVSATAVSAQFGLDEYIDYVIRIFRAIGPSFHVMAVCQSAVPVLAAISLMEEATDPHAYVVTVFITCVKNVRRIVGSKKQPRSVEDWISEFCFSTPRIIIHICTRPTH